MKQTIDYQKTLIKLKACLHINLSILHPISVKYQNIHVHIFSVSRNLVRKGAIEITLSNLFVMFISQLSATEFPKSQDGFMNETNGPIFFSFLFHYLFLFFTQILFVIICSRLVQKQALGLADMLQIYLHSPTRFHLSSKQSYFTSKESDK